MFADDTKLFKLVGKVAGFEQLQEELSKVGETATTWETRLCKGK